MFVDQALLPLSIVIILFICQIYLFFYEGCHDVHGGNTTPVALRSICSRSICHMPYRLLLIGVVRCPFILFYLGLKLLRILEKI